MFELLENIKGGEELMKSKNFEFLRPSFPELADLGGFAERYVFSDPAIRQSAKCHHGWRQYEIV
jgi:hypothetical protein